jgi:two-component system sensor histidine kinase DesK
LRHGRAGRIDLRLHRVTDGLQLVVENDGLAPGDIRPGNGLTGMRERVEALGGTLAFAPTPPRGLRLTVTLPERAS